MSNCWVKTNQMLINDLEIGREVVILNDYLPRLRNYVEGLVKNAVKENGKKVFEIIPMTNGNFCVTRKH